MWHASQLTAVSLSVLLVAQVWLGFAGDTPGPGAKALFYTEIGTTIDPKIEEGTGEPNKNTSPLMIPQAPTNQSAKGSSNKTPRPSRAASPGTREPSNPWLGIAYWVEWERPGAAPTRIADPARFVFQSGERIRFHVKTNASGYLYVINRGSSGRETVLFPHAGMSDRMNRVEARREYVIPQRGWIRFDDRPGEEGLLFLLSPQPIATFSEASFQNPVLPPWVSGRILDVVDRHGAKDLLVETDDTPGQQATYLGASTSSSVSAAEEGPIITYMTRLLHR